MMRANEQPGDRRPELRRRELSDPPEAHEANRDTTARLSDLERLAGALGGAALAAYGLRLRSMRGALWALGGGALVIRSFARTTEDTRRTLVGSRGTPVDVAVTINRPRQELYDFWSRIENLPQFMTHLESVRPIDEFRSHWVAKAPGGRTVEWDAEIINEVPGKLIAWRTIGRGDVVSAGSVHFEPAGRGNETRVRVRMQYYPPAGKLGTAVAWMLGSEPSQTIREDLRRFKALMEAGEIPTIEGQPRDSPMDG